MISNWMLTDNFDKIPLFACTLLSVIEISVEFFVFSSIMGSVDLIITLA